MRGRLHPALPVEGATLGVPERRALGAGAPLIETIAPAFLLLILALSACAGISKERKEAEQLGAQGRWDEAVDAYQLAIKREPSDKDLRERLSEAKTRAADVHFQEGKRLADRRRFAPAMDEFRKAMAFDPGRAEIQIAIAGTLKKKDAEEELAIGNRLVRAERRSEAKEHFQRAVELDPSLAEAKTALASVLRQEPETDELSLKSSRPITLRFQNARLREVFEVLSKISGINFLFDKDVRDDPLSIFVKDAPFKDALNLILATNSLFMKKISEETVLIIPKTRQKVDQYQDLLIRTFYLSNVRAKDMVNLLRTMLETRRVFVNEEVNAIILRDTPEKIKLAEKIIEANDRKVAEVMLDVEILEVDRTKSLKYGWNFNPARLSARIGGSAQTTTGEVAIESLRDLGANNIFFVLPSIIIDFLKQDSEAKTLANPRIRVIDNKSAKVNIGDRVPIRLTSTTSAVATGVTPGGVTTTTSIEFKDVGIKLVVEPNIHLNNDVTLKINLEVTSLGDLVDLGGGDRQFKFGTRNTETVLSVRDSETIVIGGLIRDEDRLSENKLPGFGDLPILGKLFGNTEKGKVTTDILLTLTPHIIHQMVAPEQDLQSFWSGTEETFSTRPLFSDFPTTGEVRREGVPPSGAPGPEPPRETPPSPPGP